MHDAAKRSGFQQPRIGSRERERERERITELFWSGLNLFLFQES
jgi:hypothetical protein